MKRYVDMEIQEFTDLSELKDVDIVHYPWFDFFAHTLPIKKQFKTVVTIHDVIPLLYPERYPVGLFGRFNFLLQRLALRNCFIITDSEISRIDINRYLHVIEEKIQVVHLAANKDFKPLNDTKLLFTKRKYNLPSSFILYVGDANWTKNLPFLIEGFKKLIGIADFKDTKLVFVGGVFLKNVENIDHPELESLKRVNKLIKDMNLEQNIMRIGNLSVEDLVAFYNLATVYVQPSLYEGFGLPIIEAFACGTPVISSNKGSLKEVGRDAAVYFDPTNLDQFVSILREVLQDKSQQNKLSKLGFEQAKKYSWEKVAKETADVYQYIVEH
ncbi:MAG: glycosyltransferase family 1 protein [Candidatus Daviesbacteria bacterium]|nr:glycosyltransferase family 1 protein [Candidatus Daviesbacteria bacterium]